MHEILSSIEFQMSLLLFVSLGGYLIASKIGQPSVVGQIILGILIGPSVLNLVTFTDFVKSMAHLGAIILLFVIGLEFKLKDIARFRFAVIAAMGIIVPWIGGFIVARMFGFEEFRAILIGVALTATSVAVTADTLKEIGKLGTDAAKVIIGAAVIDDVLALLALSVAVQVSDNTLSYGAIFFSILSAIGFLGIGAVFGQFVLNRMVVRLDHSKIARKYPELVFIFAMMSAFLYAMGAEMVGLSAIVGSFIAGVSLEGIGLKYSKNFKEGSEYLRIIFASIFFISMGVIVDIGALTLDLMIYLLVLSTVAVATKVIGCSLPAWLYGLSIRDSLVVGFGMSPRGEVAMIVALIGLNQNIIDQSSYVVLVLMSLLTTLVTPFILRFVLYRDELQLKQSV